MQVITYEMVVTKPRVNRSMRSDALLIYYNKNTITVLYDST